MAQSRVSRHLGILREAGCRARSPRGHLRALPLALPAERPLARRLGASRRRDLRRDPASRARPGRPRRACSRRARRGAAPSSTRSAPSGTRCARSGATTCCARARSRACAARELRAVDVGTGTGVLALELARSALRVVAVDHSSRMLDAARARIEARGRRRRRAAPRRRLGAAPRRRRGRRGLRPHGAPVPARAGRGAARDGARRAARRRASWWSTSRSHEREWMREELGVLRLGFAPDEIAGCLRGRRPRGASASSSSRRRRAAPTCPRTFIASRAQARSGPDDAGRTHAARAPRPPHRAPRRAEGHADPGLRALARRTSAASASRDHPRDLQGDNDVLALTRPDVLARDPPRATSRPAATSSRPTPSTPTRIAQADYGLEARRLRDEPRRPRASRAARRDEWTRARRPSRPRFVAGSIGPDEPHALDLARRERPGLPRGHLRASCAPPTPSRSAASSTAASTCSWSRRSSTR